MKKIILALAIILIDAAALFASEEIALIPQAPYDRYIIYQNLALFWIGIIGLIVIIRIKLKEIERTQKMGINKEEKDAPLLD